MYSHIYSKDDKKDTLTAKKPLIATLAMRELPPFEAFVDGRGLSCPMPLLKLKLALRKADNAVYLVATDPHAQTDISAFCQKNGLKLKLWQTKNPDTYTHFLITKTPSIS